MSKKDYCSLSPDVIQDIDLSKCCKLHDNMVGQAGTYNPITPHVAFYKCLRETKLNIFLVLIYTFFGTVFTLIKYPYLCYKKYKYRKGL